MAEEPRREDARIVEHQAIAGVEILGKVAEEAIFPAAGAAGDHPHAAAGAVAGGRLGDQLFGQLVVEVRQIHLGSLPALAKRTSAMTTRNRTVRRERSLTVAAPIRAARVGKRFFDGDKSRGHGEALASLKRKSTRLNSSH